MVEKVIKAPIFHTGEREEVSSDIELNYMYFSVKRSLRMRSSWRSCKDDDLKWLSGVCCWLLYVEYRLSGVSCLLSMSIVAPIFHFRCPALLLRLAWKILIFGCRLLISMSFVAPFFHCWCLALLFRLVWKVSVVWCRLFIIDVRCHSHFPLSVPNSAL